MAYRRQPIRWRRSCCAGERPLCCAAAASPPTSARCGRRTGRQRAVAGEGTLGETAAGERRRGCRIGADVPALTAPDLVLTMWGASCPDGGAVADGRRRASGARRLGRRRSYGGPGPYEAGPAADTASAWSVPPYMHPPPATPQPSPTRPSRQRPVNRPPRQPVKGGQSIEKATPLFPPDPLQKSEKKVKDNLKWRIN